MQETLVVSGPGSSLVDAGVRLCQLAGAFIASCDVAPSSRMTYRRALKAFFDWLSRTGRADRLDKLSRFDILAYKDELGRTKRVATSNMYVFIVQQFFAWLEEHKVHADITKGIKCFKMTPGHAKDCLTVEQVRRIIAGFNRYTPTGCRDYALFNLMVRTGLREIEVARATVGDIRDESGEAVLWVRGKGRAEKDAFVLLVPEALQPIREWLASQHVAAPDAPLFMSLSRGNRGQAMTTRSISKIVKDAMRRVGIDSKRLTPHSLRHTAILLAIAGGASLTQAQAMARHSNPRTTMVYFHNFNRVREAAEKCVNL